MTIRTISAFVLAVAALPAAAQPIYRCGNAYSEQPCEGAKQIDTSAHSPSAEDAKAASERAARTEKLALRMEKERLTQEKRVAGPAMIVTGQRPVALKAAAGAGSPKGEKPARLPVDFSATAPAKAGESKPKKKSG